ncbi:MAG: thiol peroxidase [Myxococcales bacterium]|nr:thiol peroxidase [Myxococcales bacterium]
MAKITFKGKPVETNGELPAVGSKAPALELTKTDLSDVTLSAFAGKKKLLTINPSLDTGVCQATVRNFNKKATERGDTVVLSISSDLPFAAKRFCTAEGIEAVVPLSLMRSRKFAKDWGLLMTDGPLAGLVARAVVVLDENDVVKYVELVPEIAQEPNYEAALAAL